MLQWLPGSRSEVIWNDRQGDRFVSHVLDVKTRKRRTLPGPIYAVSPDGRSAVAPDFRRLADTRPGYGYAGVADPRRDDPAPGDAGIWRLDLRAGKQALLLSFADVVKILAAEPFAPGAKHWLNHLLYAPDGRRFVFLHRWSTPGQKGWRTRMITARADGGDPYVLNPHGMTSHFIWRDPEHILAWSRQPKTGNKFHLFRDRSTHVEVVGDGVLTEDGHCTYVPRRGNEWILNDTYAHANKERLQHVHLFHVPTGRLVTVGKLHAPAAYEGPWRCDTHPRLSRDGTKVVVDSPHAGGRQLHLFDIAKIVGPPRG
jgi:hypothetical protein